MSMFDNYPDPIGYIPSNRPKPLYETIKQGSTRTLEFDLDIETTNISELMVSFIQGFDVILTKSLNDVTLGARKVILNLTQADTLKLNPFEFIYAQVRVKKIINNVETVYNSSIVKLFVEGAVNPTSL